MSKNNNKVIVTNAIAIALQTRAAIAAGLVAIRKDEKLIRQCRADADAALVGIVNAMYRQGMELQSMCGESQVTFSFIQPIQEQLPWDFKTAKSRIALTLHMPQGEIKSFQELANDTQKEILRQLDFCGVAEHLGGGGAIVQDKFTLFLNDMTRMKQDVQKLFREKALRERSPAQLQTFLDDTQWVDEVRAEAMRLLAG